MKATRRGTQGLLLQQVIGIYPLLGKQNKSRKKALTNRKQLELG
jgi:hypothetical protein